MRSLHVRTDGTGRAKLESLALPFIQAGPTATADDLARTPAPEVAQAYGAVRLTRHADGDVLPGSGLARHLRVVVSGAVEVTAPYMSALLGPGDVLFVDAGRAAGDDGFTLTHRGDGRTVEIDVTDTWQPQGVVPPPVDDDGRGHTDVPAIERVHVVDEQARFAAVPGLFPESPGSLDIGEPLATMLLSLSPDSFGDWHTEEPVTLVVVLSGGFEIEVGGGGGAVHCFRAGDVVLVQNHTGQGHITRTHGETRFIGLTYAPDQTWAT